MVSVYPFPLVQESRQTPVFKDGFFYYDFFSDCFTGMFQKGLAKLAQDVASISPGRMLSFLKSFSFLRKILLAAASGCIG